MVLIGGKHGKSLEAMNSKEKDLYLAWLLEKFRYEENLREKERHSMQPLSAVEYLKMLSSLELTSIDNISSFAIATQGLSIAPAVQSIPLGSNGSTKYFLGSQICPLLVGSQAQTTTKGSPENHPYILHFHSAGTQPAKVNPLSYGVYLGSLTFSLGENDPLEKTGFHVVLNALDHSIWIIFDYNPYDDVGDRQEIALHGIFSPSSLREIHFDALPIFGGDVVKKGLAAHTDRILFDPTMLKGAIIAKLSAAFATMKEVEAAMHLGGLQPNPVPSTTTSSAPATMVAAAGATPPQASNGISPHETGTAPQHQSSDSSGTAKISQQLLTAKAPVQPRGGALRAGS